MAGGLLYGWHDKFTPIDTFRLRRVTYEETSYEPVKRQATIN